MFVLPVLLWPLLGPATPAEIRIPPPSREVVRTEMLRQWTFDRGTEGWKPQHNCELAWQEGRMVIQCTGEDPYFFRPVNLPVSQWVFRLRARCRGQGGGAIYWTTDRSPHWGQDKSASFSLTHDGQWHESSVRVRAPGRLTNLRIDPGGGVGTIEIDWIRLVREIRHPLTIEKIERVDNRVRFTIKNHHAKPVRFSAAGQDHTLAAGETVSVERPIKKDRPLESVSLEVNCKGRPPVSQLILLHHPEAQTDWIEKTMGSGQLLVARDGSLARFERDGKLVAVLGPLVHRGGRVPALKLRDDGSPLRFEGEGVSLTLSNDDRQISIAINSRQECEGPVVRAIGGLEQGLLAGLEYLGKDEKSSSKLDIETEGYRRFLPDVMKVTMPLMALATDRATVAMTWKDMQLQPFFAAPHATGPPVEHYMALRGKTIDATVLIDQAPLEEAILWAVNRTGLPPLPKPPRDEVGQREVCLRALEGPLKTDVGWGHCAGRTWTRHWFGDMGSAVWRLSGKIPEFPTLVPGGAHVRSDTIYFLTGRADLWLKQNRGQIQGILRRQQEDGSFRYSGKFRRGHFEDTASGYCAGPAMRLLEHARLTGDKEAQDAGIRTLEYIKRFRTPRGAQVWELSLHTPDLLASAYLVWAYVRGYELTGNREYLKLARKWALSGIPFVYLWSNQPIMVYATTPVYGATHWCAPNWMGLPVQWVGGVYAYALALLAPHQETLDWNHLARGILISAQQQQYPTGPHIGLLPDSFDLRAQRRQPADINPCALVSLQWILDGKLDSLAVAASDNYRVVAPFPVQVRGNRAHIQAKSGIKYQILVDGTRIVEVHSKGNDIVPLSDHK